MNRLEVAALLTAKMVEKGSSAVAITTQQPVIRLYRMIEGATPFNRAVLRYLSLRQVVSYHPLQKGSPDDCET